MKVKKLKEIADMLSKSKSESIFLYTDEKRDGVGISVNTSRETLEVLLYSLCERNESIAKVMIEVAGIVIAKKMKSELIYLDDKTKRKES